MYKLINFALFDTMLSQNHIIKNITYCTPLSGEGKFGTRRGFNLQIFGAKKIQKSPNLGRIINAFKCPQLRGAQIVGIVSTI